LKRSFTKTQTLTRHSRVCGAPIRRTNFRRKSAPGVTRVHPKRQNHDDTNSIAHLEQGTTTLGEFEPGIALGTICTADRRVPGLAVLQTDAAGVRSYPITRYVLRGSQQLSTSGETSRNREPRLQSLLQVFSSEEFPQQAVFSPKEANYLVATNTRHRIMRASP
jgi:hypothetical protein